MSESFSCLIPDAYRHVYMSVHVYMYTCLMPTCLMLDAYMPDGTEIVCKFFIIVKFIIVNVCLSQIQICI